MLVSECYCDAIFIIVKCHGCLNKTHPDFIIFLLMMQGKKFKDKTQTQKDAQITALPDNDPNLSDSDGDQQRGKSDQFPMPFPKRGNDGAGDGFVTSIRGLFNTQKKKAKAYVLRTMRGEGDNEHGEWSDGDVELSPFARQLTIAKTKKLIRRHSKKFVQSTSGE